MKTLMVVTVALAASFAGLLVGLGPTAFAADTFVVKSLGNGTAALSGDGKGLSAGDSLYYSRSPFRFRITEVKGGQVTIALPANHDLRPEATLLREPSDSIRKNMETEQKLKRALED